MGCCGEEEEDILQPLDNQQNLTLHSSSSSMASPVTGGDDSYTTISPMNSNFEALICKDILRTIFEKLPVVDLARSACVCRLWSSVASDREIQVRAFTAPWKLKGVIGNPSSGSFWRDNRLSRFAISHRLVRGDTVASLAVKYSVQIKEQLNADLVTVNDAYGDGRHVSIDVVSSAFEGQSAVNRQRMVYKAIWEELQNVVHAVDQMTTRTPEEAASGK